MSRTCMLSRFLSFDFDIRSVLLLDFLLRYMTCLFGVKVLCADSDSKVLGFLPRELAQHLSPVMDNYDLRFKVLLF